MKNYTVPLVGLLLGIALMLLSISWHLSSIDRNLERIAYTVAPTKAQMDEQMKHMNDTIRGIVRGLDDKR